MRPAVVDYLGELREEVIEELERETIAKDRLETLQNRLYVLRSIAERIDRDVQDGLVAEKELREAEVDGDV